MTEEKKIMDHLNILRYKPESHLDKSYSEEETLAHIKKVIAVTGGVSPRELEELCFIMWGQNKKDTRAAMYSAMDAGIIYANERLRLVLKEGNHT